MKKRNTEDEADGTHWRSVIANINCEHHHTLESALECAAVRICNGELIYYIGEDEPLIVSPKQLKKYVKKYRNKDKYLIQNGIKRRQG